VKLRSVRSSAAASRKLVTPWLAISASAARAALRASAAPGRGSSASMPS
jgi:hypothetical protein